MVKAQDSSPSKANFFGTQMKGAYILKIEMPLKEKIKQRRGKRVISQRMNYYLILDDQTPTTNLSKQNCRKLSQKGLLKTGKNKKRNNQVRIELLNAKL
jgi:hypothetical protein